MDQSLFHLINQQWTSPALDLFMAALSDPQVWLPLFVALVLYALIWGGFKGRAFLLCLAITLLISEGVVVQGLKKAIGRQRPKQAETVRLVQLAPTRPKFLSLLQPPRVHSSAAWQRREEGHGNSFPSAHTVNNFVAATFLVLFFRPWGWLYSPVAAMISYSRIYLGAHWPSDVVISAFLAVGMAFLFVMLFEWIWQWAGRRWLPEIFSRHPRIIAAK
ncbi:MAG: phosphatase PAP2 family protein [Chthoniobacterales bacterium]